MKSIFPILGQASYANIDSSNKASLVPPSLNTWDITSAPLSFAIQVPMGERWLTHFDVASYISGPNVPTYQCAFGVVLRGATIFNPLFWGYPGSYMLGVNVQGDAAWGAASIPIWLNPGITVCNFGIARDAGAITVARREIRGTPYLGMKI